MAFRRVHRALGWKFWAVISGGATLPGELEDFWNRLGFALIQGYGMTETAALVTLNHPFHIGRGTIGKALPGREVRISEEGEILVRGEMLAGATWQGGAMRPREGEWLATGDLAAKERVGGAAVSGAQGRCDCDGCGDECASGGSGNGDDEAGWGAWVCGGALRDEGWAGAGGGGAVCGERCGA